MKVNTIYPVTTADKVTKVADPTNGGNKASLAEVLANMASKYASLDKTGEGARTSETWHKKDNHISFGGLQSSVDYDDKTALDLLKAVLSPEYYPYKKSTFSLRKSGNDVFTWYNSNTHRKNYYGVAYPNLSLIDTVSIWSYPSTGGYNATEAGRYILDNYTWSRLSPVEGVDAFRITYYVDPTASITLNNTLYTSLGEETTYISKSKDSQNYDLTIGDLEQKDFSTQYYKITVKKPLVVYKDGNDYVPCWWLNDNPTNKEVECKAIAGKQPVFYVLKDAVLAAKTPITFSSKNELGGKTMWAETVNTTRTNTSLNLKMSGNLMVVDQEGEQSNDDGSDTLEYLKFTTEAPTENGYWTKDVIIHATINL